MLSLLLLFALNSFLYCLKKKKKASLLLTNQNGEIFSCILLGNEIELVTMSFYLRKVEATWKPLKIVLLASIFAFVG